MRVSLIEGILSRERFDKPWLCTDIWESLHVSIPHAAPRWFSADIAGTDKQLELRKLANHATVQFRSLS